MTEDPHAALWARLEHRGLAMENGTRLIAKRLPPVKLDGNCLFTSVRAILVLEDPTRSNTTALQLRKQAVDLFQRHAANISDVKRLALERTISNEYWPSNKNSVVLCRRTRTRSNAADGHPIATPNVS